jgi:hypothetical protein
MKHEWHLIYTKNQSEAAYFKWERPRTIPFRSITELLNCNSSFLYFGVLLPLNDFVPQNYLQMYGIVKKMTLPQERNYASQIKNFDVTRHEIYSPMTSYLIESCIC